MDILEYNLNIVDFVNTSEAYSKKLYVGNENIVIPYVSIELMKGNPIRGNRCVADFSYYVFRGVFRTNASRINKMLSNVGNAITDIGLSEYVMVGGYDTDLSEVEINCSEVILFLRANTTFSNTQFIPKNTGIFRMNMDKDKVVNFFQEDSLPEKLKILLGRNYRVLDGVE